MITKIVNKILGVTKSELIINGVKEDLEIYAKMWHRIWLVIHVVFPLMVIMALSILLKD